jgi:hypothetical protein
MKRKQIAFEIPWPTFSVNKQTFLPAIRKWLPSRGNVLFTLVMIAVLLWAQSAGAVPFRAESATSTGTIAYQGRLADSSGNPLTSTLNMSFRLYSAVTGGAPLWTEQWTGSNGVKVSDGLFNVMLGSLTPIAQAVITGNSTLFLGITVGTDDEMAPRVQLGSVPFAVQALTVPDGSITTVKIADGAITGAKLAGGNGNSLTVSGEITATGNINMGGILTGPKSFWADYRSYVRFVKQDGATDANMCPEGGVAVGVSSPLRSLSLKTGNDIATAAYPRGGTCVNVHQMAPCGTINGTHYPYNAESCTADFSGKWAPYYWDNGEPTHDVTMNLLGSGIGCYSLKYACVNLNP